MDRSNMALLGIACFRTPLAPLAVSIFRRPTRAPRPRKISLAGPSVFPQISSYEPIALAWELTHIGAPLVRIRRGGNAMLFAIVRRGKLSGIHLYPHRYKEDDRYHVSLVRKGPHIPLADDRDIPDYLANGYLLGMSNPEVNYKPTLIRPASIRGWE